MAWKEKYIPRHLFVASAMRQPLKILETLRGVNAGTLIFKNYTCACNTAAFLPASDKRQAASRILTMLTSLALTN